MIGLVDTSVFVATEHGLASADQWPQEVAVPVPTLAELELGVLLASDLEQKERRLATLHLANTLSPIPIDEAVARQWARLVARLREAGSRAPINDVWIAATALVHDMAVVTRDSDYDVIAGVTVIRV